MYSSWHVCAQFSLSAKLSSQVLKPNTLSLCWIESARQHHNPWRTRSRGPQLRKTPCREKILDVQKCKFTVHCWSTKRQIRALFLSVNKKQRQDKPSETKSEDLFERMCKLLELTVFRVGPLYAQCNIKEKRLVMRPHQDLLLCFTELFVPWLLPFVFFMWCGVDWNAIQMLYGSMTEISPGVQSLCDLYLHIWEIYSQNDQMVFKHHRMFSVLHSSTVTKAPLSTQGKCKMVLDMVLCFFVIMRAIALWEL